MYSPAANRYDSPNFYRRLRRSGVQLPLISLGLCIISARTILTRTPVPLLPRVLIWESPASNLANNYGPPAGSAEETFGRILRGRPRLVA